jgi:hypothetical protein
MITVIPENQKCQAFDPMMLLPDKTKEIIKDYMKASTSCVAPAYVYLEGSRGKRFLCDFHYHYEKDAALDRTPEQWPLINQYMIEKLEDIKLTFSSKKTNLIDDNSLCWCKAKAMVLSISKHDGKKHYHCNFHFRKMYFRFLSNGVMYEDRYDIIDERYKMSTSIKEELDQLSIL